MEALWSGVEALLGLSATQAEELSTLQVCLRAIVVYLVLIGYVRFAKKRFLGEATGFDAILVIVIGSIASRAISGTAPFIASLAGTFILVLVHWVISFITQNSPMLNYVTKGRDTDLIRDGKIDLPWQHLTCRRMILPKACDRKASKRLSK
jgi:Predicted membrane protein